MGLTRAANLGAIWAASGMSKCVIHVGPKQAAIQIPVPLPMWDPHCLVVGTINCIVNLHKIYNVFFYLQVTNTIPSVSAVTGIRPQAYIWRISIGLHSTPRLLVGFMYYNYFMNSLQFKQKNLQGLYKCLMYLCYCLYMTECLCLVFVSCISNRENYRKSKYHFAT